MLKMSMSLLVFLFLKGWTKVTSYKFKVCENVLFTQYLIDVGIYTTAHVMILSSNMQSDGNNVSLVWTTIFAGAVI